METNFAHCNNWLKRLLEFCPGIWCQKENSVLCLKVVFCFLVCCLISEEFYIILSVVYNLIILHLEPPLKCCVFLENEYLVGSSTVVAVPPSWLDQDETWFSKAAWSQFAPIIPFNNAFTIWLTSVFESVTYPPLLLLCFWIMLWEKISLVDFFFFLFSLISEKELVGIHCCCYVWFKSECFITVACEIHKNHLSLKVWVLSQRWGFTWARLQID